METINPLVNTINKNIGKSALVTYKLGLGEETIVTRLLEVSDSLISVVCTHPEPFLNESILIQEFTRKDGEVMVPKLVTSKMIPINNILGFKIL
jgi:hypothetical protein